LDKLMLREKQIPGGNHSKKSKGKSETQIPFGNDKQKNEGCRVVYISPLKALAVDVERNLRSPLVGMAAMAERMGVPVRTPEISVRTGDTSPKERARFKRHPGEILITTPESLYLLLTSDAGEGLRSVETVIIDEIHALVPTKRGAHLMLSLERLEAMAGRPLQRIGLSATQRPLEEVARFLGGAEEQGVGSRDQGVGKAAEGLRSVKPTDRHEAAMDAVPRDFGTETSSNEVNGLAGEPQPVDRVEIGVRFRPVTIVHAGAKKILELKVEVPVEDMARLGEVEDLPSGPASQGPKRTSIWQSIYPRLLEVVRGRISRGRIMGRWRRRSGRRLRSC
jgi:ATP-dependent Lhr-like helicase